MAWPTDPLDVLVELSVGGVWTDITAYTYLRDPITITRGRQDEATAVDPASCNLKLNNRDGRFSARNPTSPYYGLVGRNTPVRVSVRAGTPYLGVYGGSSDRASTPDAAVLDITGDLDVRVDARLDNWFASTTQVIELAGKWGAAGQHSWALTVFQGRPALLWTVDGTTQLGQQATVPLPVLPSGRIAIRATLDVNDGAGNNVVTFYTAATLAGTWVQLGAPIVTAGTTSVFASTAALDVGAVTGIGTGINPIGAVYSAEVRSGIAGTVVADPVFTAQSVGSTGFTDAAGRAWSLSGAAAITNTHVRFAGEVAAWPPTWDVSGRDVTVPIQAAGIMRRLGQGAKPLASTLRRRIPSGSPTAYWPMEDDSTATQAYSPITGVPPMATTNLSFASDSSLAGSSPLPTTGTSASISGRVPPATAGAWQVELVYNIGTAPAGDANAQMLVVNTTTGRWRIGIGASAFHLDVTDPSGSSLYSQSVLSVATMFGQWGRLRLEASQSGGNVSLAVTWIPIGGSGTSWSDTFAGTAGAVSTISTPFADALQGMGVGHIAVFPTTGVGIFNSADLGFAGESVHTRLARLSGEENVPLVLPAMASDPAMGPQTLDTLLTLVQQGGDVDQGILREDRNTISLSYRPRESMYNQPAALALTYTTDGHVAPPLQPVDDDQHIRNDITVQRSGGSAARAVATAGTLSTAAPPAGVGVYDTSVTINCYDDGQPSELASWLLHVGTWDEARYPQVHVALHKAPSLVDAAVAVDSGDVLTISNLPSWLPPGLASLMEQGSTEVLGVRTWDITFNCTPAGPWEIGVRDDAARGRRDTAGSQLASGVNATATSWSVATTLGPLWTTAAGDVPFNVTCGGEVVTVTAISGTSSPQTFTVTRSVNGVVKSQPAGAAINLSRPTVRAL